MLAVSTGGWNDLFMNCSDLKLLFVLFQVLMKDITTPVPPDEMKNLVQNCLEKAAGINYSQLIEFAQIHGQTS